MLHKLFLIIVMTCMSVHIKAVDIKARLSLKTPGNPSVSYSLTSDDGNRLLADKDLPVEIVREKVQQGNKTKFSVTIKAKKQVYFNLNFSVETGFNTNDCDFYLPGFWYHKNLRSPVEAPSFKSAKSWNFREDRLSAPLTGVYNGTTHQFFTVTRQLDSPQETLTSAIEGEVILSGNTSLGYLGFDNEKDIAALTFGYPYQESPKRYIRKLTLTPQIVTFAKLNAGESKTITWNIETGNANSYGDFVRQTWIKSFDEIAVKPLTPLYTPEEVKAQLCSYFRNSFVTDYQIKFNSGENIAVDNCKSHPTFAVGFVGRSLLNAFNQLEYGNMHRQPDLVEQGNKVIASFEAYGFSAKGYMHDFINFEKGIPGSDEVHTIRQQSEGIYALLHYLMYERKHGRVPKSLEKKIRRLLDLFVSLQKKDGSFARKFNEDGTDIDGSGGSTPSATVPLVMGYHYFKDKRYLTAAKHTIDYLEKNIIAKSDYFSSTLDANCEDKEAAITAATATYYMALISSGKEQKRYVDLCKRAAYFAASWYYLWDVPFAQGQMLGDLNFKSRGWGNVSVENNHIDVFVFELPHIFRWLGKKINEPRFTQLDKIITNSLCQLLPTSNHLCGIGKPGYYPEVVQHTTWDYGKNGKGFYNNIFAPGWTVASLWELYSPDRTTGFFQNK